MSTCYRTVDVDGVNVFYGEAGPDDAPVLLLLHGFPSASHMFRDLIAMLAGRFRLFAPDLPGFGQSAQPPRESVPYTFDNLARVIDRFTELLGLTRYALDVFDYGAPIGFRLAVKHPERITAIVIRHRTRRTAMRSAPSSRLRQRSFSRFRRRTGCSAGRRACARPGILGSPIWDCDLLLNEREAS